MAEQSFSTDLSPQLCAVLSSLNVNLEAELNRYRRNRRLDGIVTTDIFADLQDPSFDLTTIESALAPAPKAAAVTPPPLPANRRLLDQAPATNTQETALATTDKAAAEPMASTASVTQPAAQPVAQPSLASSLVKATATAQHSPSTELPPAAAETNAAVHPNSAITSASGYLASSEKLIESLTEVPPLPEPVNISGKPKRKTVSLLAGATLGLCGLAAGLGASYLMANPSVTQRLASQIQREGTDTATAPPSSFDPPGPDLSANEFIELDLDNLSSLNMPQGTIDPNALPPEATELPPIAPTAPATPATNTQIPAGLANPSPETVPGTIPNATPSAASAPQANAPIGSSPPIGTQAVVVPVGLTYYVTVPYSTDQGLLTVREVVSEAFIRQFTDGIRIQIAAFDNPQAAQTFVEELKGKEINAQIYGPTTE
ncbi:MAG: hypothetical protein AAFR58_24405 [Cyanobacteria bacterium J06627_28]